MKCKKCGSENVHIQLVNVSKKKNIIIRMLLFFPKLILFVVAWVLWVIIMLLSLVFPFLRSKRDVLRKVAVCQDCGYSWKAKGKDIKV